MRKLTFENYHELQPYIALANYNEYNSNTMTLLMWSIRYEAYFETYPTYAVVYTKMPNMKPVWLMPYCKTEHRRDAMQEIQRISIQEGIPFEIHSMVKEFKDWLLETYPLSFLVWDCYNAQDYIYDRMQQQSLVGKKMQKRRNHFHAFLKQYEHRFQYKALEKDDIPHINAFLEEWRQHKKEEEQETISAEFAGIQAIFEHFDNLPIVGGCIYIDGKLEAFNIASYLADDTIQIHVEKANKTIRGLYIAILKYFLETLDENILYINREDDMGLEDLRKAKRDMQPIRKIQKFGSAYQTLSIIQADETWLKDIKNLWLESYQEETKESSEFLFQNFYAMSDTWLLVSDDELISMVQVRKMTLSIQGKQEPVSFLYGVATSDDYAGCGFMKVLLEYVLKEKAKTEKYALLQAYNWDIYRSLGFVEAYKKACYKIDKQAYPETDAHRCTEINLEEMLHLYECYTKNKDGYRIRDLAYYTNQFLPYHNFWKQKVNMILNEQEEIIGYVVYTDEEEIRIHECIYKNEADLSKILGCFTNDERKVYLETDIDIMIEGRRKEATCMMVKTLSNLPFPKEHLFIHEEL